MLQDSKRNISIWIWAFELSDIFENKAQLFAYKIQLMGEFETYFFGQVLMGQTKNSRKTAA